MNITSAKYIQAPTTEGGTPVNKSVLAVIDNVQHLMVEWGKYIHYHRLTPEIMKCKKGKY